MPILALGSLAVVEVQRNSVRIIGGKWRRRRIPVGSPRLRPSPDRVRETLFNWLQPHLYNASVLDLFAGTGALGLEAVSRGAARAVLIDSDRSAVDSMRRAAASLQASSSEIQIFESDVLAWMRDHRETSWDIAFVDPPFDAPPLRDGALRCLAPLLAPAGLLYLQRPIGVDSGLTDFEIVKSMSAGAVEALLLRPHSDCPAPRGTSERD